VELVTKWKISIKNDEFFGARIELTFYYSITAVIILGGTSIILYNTILNNFTHSVLEMRINPIISQLVIDQAKNVLLDRFITIDLLIIFFVIVLGFILSQKTLGPIKSNMQKQKRFIMDASHELRTPTAVVISGLEVALSNKKLDFSSAKKTLENTLEEMRDFSKLSNNLLDISKYDTPVNTSFEDIEINKLVKSIVEKSTNLANIKNIKIETKIESEAVIKGNKIELGRVFYNILDNAIKYTDSNGEIIISDKITFDKYTLIFIDDGVGIPKDILNKIFDPFFRGDISRNTNGAGLGLTMSKKIIENHKGTISVKNRTENNGVCVTISLPISSQ
jgi:signal transduction histidine kinase